MTMMLITPVDEWIVRQWGSFNPEEDNEDDNNHVGHHLYCRNKSDIRLIDEDTVQLERHTAVRKAVTMNA